MTLLKGVSNEFGTATQKGRVGGKHITSSLKGVRNESKAATQEGRKGASTSPQYALVLLILH